jgi:hypothetical protein
MDCPGYEQSSVCGQSGLHSMTYTIFFLNIAYLDRPTFDLIHIIFNLLIYNYLKENQPHAKACNMNQNKCHNMYSLIMNNKIQADTPGYIQTCLSRNSRLYIFTIFNGIHLFHPC